MLPITADKNNTLHHIVRKFYSGSLDLKLQDAQVNDLTLSEQEKFLKTTLNQFIQKKYPMRGEFVKLFLKKLIGYLETSQDVHDDLYKYLCTVMTDESSNYNYRHYIIGQELNNIITLRETNNLVVNGTTGMRTWEAALMLADWALCHVDLIRNKKILELGSGIGFTGITLAKFCEPAKIILTDCHDDVLSTIEENININFDCLQRKKIPNGVMFEEKNVNIGVMNFDWTNITDFPFDMCPDIIIGADIVYDPLILQPLCDVIKAFFNINKDLQVYIAGVLRNQDTLNMFLESLVTASFKYEKVHQEKNVFIDWNRDTQRYLLKIST